MNNRKTLRLQEYDYSKEGLYFITICVQNRECLFGNIYNDKMVLNDAGEMIESQWLVLLERFNNIKLHHYVIMPNHFHAIIEIVGVPLVGTYSNVKKTLGDMIGAFKSISTNQYIKGVKNSAWEQFNKRLWQRNYWEHIIRNENEYTQRSQYIIDNPQKWEIDKLNPNENIEIKEMSYLNE